MHGIYLFIAYYLQLLLLFDNNDDINAMQSCIFNS